MAGPQIGCDDCGLGIQWGYVDGDSLDELLDAFDCLVAATGRAHENFRKRGRRDGNSVTALEPGTDLTVRCIMVGI
ncbi:MAG: hypothetical protein WD598_00575 [Acidimicrobiia bacterium]